MIQRFFATRRAVDDQGFALVTVIGSMLALSAFALAALGYAVQNIPQSRRTQDFHGSFAAAQAGVDDYLQRLNACDVYWQRGSTALTDPSKPCPTVQPNPALDGIWTQVPGTTGGDGRYTYRLLAVPAPVAGSSLPVIAGTIRLQVDGRSMGVQRTVTVDLRKPGFLRYIYYTDKETTDPDLYPTLPAYQGYTYAGRTGSGTRNDPYYYYAYGPVTTPPAECGRYHYATATTAARNSFPRSLYKSNANDGSGSYPNYVGLYDYSCGEIQFAGGDTISGRLHSNDSLLVGGAVTFTKPETESSWPVCDPSTGSPQANCWWGSGTPSSSGYRPVYAKPILPPPDNRDLLRYADGLQGGRGCLYTGPTEIHFRSDGYLDVFSPFTKKTNPGCTTDADPNNVAMTGFQRVKPANGVVYVQKRPTSGPYYKNCTTSVCTGKVLGTYPVSGDVTAYSWNSADTFVKGTGLTGRFTVASESDVAVIGNITYAGGTDGSNIVGLIANNNVEVYHPVASCSSGSDCVNGLKNLAISGQPAATDTSGAPAMEIDAAILSVAHSFTVQNYYGGLKYNGKLKVVGTIAQRYRGAVGTSGSSGTGYLKLYTYDDRLLTQPPPYFLDPEGAAWTVVSTAEQ